MQCEIKHISCLTVFKEKNIVYNQIFGKYLLYFSYFIFFYRLAGCLFLYFLFITTSSRWGFCTFVSPKVPKALSPSKAFSFRSYSISSLGFIQPWLLPTAKQADHIIPYFLQFEQYACWRRAV